MILSDTLKNERAKVLADAIDAGSATLQLLINANDIETFDIPFSDPCYADITDGVLTFAPLPETMIPMSGEVKSAVIVNDGTVLAYLTVSDNDGSGDLKLPSLMLFQGSILRIANWQIKEL